MTKPFQITPCSHDYHEWFDEIQIQKADWPEQRRKEFQILGEEMLDDDTFNMIRICSELLERATK